MLHIASKTLASYQTNTEIFSRCNQFQLTARQGEWCTSNIKPY